MRSLPSTEPLAIALTAAIRTGDLVTLRRLLAGDPDLARTSIASTGPSAGTRSLLHVATDWPGCFPGGAAIISTLIAAGADPNAPFAGAHAETPLHWAASCDDVAAIDALLDGGADIEASGGVIGGGTPIADAVAFGQWKAARRLIDRGARTTLWQAAALGLLDRMERLFQAPARPGPDEIANAFWCACHGGQLAAAAFLLDRGADPNRVGPDGLTPLDAAARSGAGALVGWLRRLGARSASPPDGPPEA